MKRLVAAIFLLVTVISLSITANILVSKSVKSFDKRLEKCEKACINEDWTEASLQAKALIKDWQKERKWLSIFVNRGLLDDITTSAAQLLPYGKAKSTDVYLGECAAFSELLESVRQEQTLSFESFF